MSEAADKIVSRGTATAFPIGDILNGNGEGGQQQQGAAAGDDGNDGKDDGNSGNGDGNNGGGNEPVKAVLTEEQQLAFMKEQLGFEGSLEELKAKLKPQAAEPSEEDKKKAAAALEKRMLDAYLSQGGKMEDFVGLKKVLELSEDQTSELARTEIYNELVGDGYTEEDAKAITKQMFLQHDLDTIEQEDGESEEDFNKRKEILKKDVSYGAKKLAKRGIDIKQQAQSVWDALKQSIELQDKEAAGEVELSKSIDSHLQSVPRKIEIEIGTVNQGFESESAIGKLPINVSDDVINEIATTLKNKETRNAIIFDDKGNVNHKRIADLLLKEKLYEESVKVSFGEGYNKGKDKQVAVFQQRFPARSAFAVGVGGAAQKTDTKVGEPVKRGATEKFVPSLQN